jgi:hypothetical protein
MRRISTYRGITMYKIIQLRGGNDLFSSPHISSEHETLEAALNKCEHMFMLGNWQRDNVCIPIKGPSVINALLFSHDAEDFLLRRSMEIGWLDVSAYIFSRRRDVPYCGDRCISYRAYDFNSETGLYDEWQDDYTHDQVRVEELMKRMILPDCSRVWT